jgi:hypothetical protein
MTNILAVLAFLALLLAVAVSSFYVVFLTLHIIQYNVLRVLGKVKEKNFIEWYQRWIKNIDRKT